MKHPVHSSSSPTQVVLETDADVSLPIHKINWLLEQLQQSTAAPVSTNRLNLRVLPPVLAKLSGQRPSPLR